MPSPRAESVALASVWRLALDEVPRSGLLGERLGRGTGSSVEFQDRREYQLGDDVRHIDWRSYARTDKLHVKLYREEILPRVELLVDCSASMGVHPEKAALTSDLTALLAAIGREDSLAVKVVTLGDGPQVLPVERLQSDGVDSSGSAPLSLTLREASGLLRRGTQRILISDFLSPHDADDLVAQLAAGASAFSLVQVLAPDDADPQKGTSVRLVDSETSETLDLVLDRPTVDRYSSRLERLTGALRTETRRLGGRFVRLVAGKSVEALCRDELGPAGLLEPRG